MTKASKPRMWILFFIKDKVSHVERVFHHLAESFSIREANAASRSINSNKA